jgi:hypothetical protein
MGLINSTRDILRVGLREGVRYRAIVTDNKDPKQLGRIKFKIPKFFELELKDSPWAICANAGIDGGTKESGSLDIPRIDSFVEIMFMHGSPYHPKYFSTTLFKPNQLKQAQVNYPDRKIIRLSNKAFLVVDLHNNLIQVYNPGDVSIEINGSCGINVQGTTTLSSVGDTTISVSKGNLNATVLKGDANVVTEKGDIIASSANDVSVIASHNIYLTGGSGDGDLAGVVTGACTCAFTGGPHPDYSNNVFATTGGS